MLKRFKWQRRSTRAQKVQDCIKYPLQGLDIGPFMARAAGEEALYDLYAVVRHHGRSIGGGHYTTVALHPETHHWLAYSDTNVAPVDPDVHTNDGGAAYVLFYRRAD